MNREQGVNMDKDRPAILTPEQRTERAINVLREYASASESQEPRITATSTGVMINRAQQLVREAT